MPELFEKQIYLSPRDLSGDIESRIFDTLSKITKQECTEQYGHVLFVNKIVSFTNRISPANSAIIFTVKFEAATLKPEVGKIMEGAVSMVFEKGIFLKVQDKIKVFVPVNQMDGYLYDEDDDCCNHPTEETIMDEKILSVCITRVEYSNHKFNCFGKLVET